MEWGWVMVIGLKVPMGVELNDPAGLIEYECG
jgi:hypothetical protein